MTDAGPASTTQLPPPSGREFLRLLGLGALIGIPAAFAAAVFYSAIHQLQTWLWTDLPDALGSSSPRWYLLLGLPLLGAGITAAARAWLPGDGGHPPLDGLKMEPTPFAHLPGIVVAAFGTLAFGAVLGPESPVIAIGSGIALGIVAFARLSTRENRMLGMAGSFSAISSLFGGPIVGGVLLTEAGVGLGANLVAALAPGFVAAAVGYVIFIGLGDWPGIATVGLTVPDLPPYKGTNVLDLVMAPVVGVVTAVGLAFVHRAGRRLAPAGERRLGMAGFLLAGGLAVGLIALAGDALGANPQDVLFSGQSGLPDEIAEGTTVALVVLLLAKTLAYIVSLSCGFRGGPIFPAIFIGVAVATFPVIWFDVSPTWAIAVGAAAGMAGQTRLILTSMLFGALLVGTQDLATTPAAVLAAVAAWAAATVIAKRSAVAAGQPEPGPTAPSR
jgi:H+/Cl- antiporter ClcA